MHRHTIHRAIVAAAMPMLAACSLGLTDVPDPSTITSPDIVKTQAGAVGLYSDALSRFNRVYAGTFTTLLVGSSFALASGLGSDEFGGNKVPSFSLRQVGIGGLNSGRPQEQPYSDMSTTRLMIDQAIGALKAYGTTSPSSYVSQLYALRGYISVMFAELYCSGTPLSRAVYGGDIEIGHPKTTVELFGLAIADFDSALAIQTDSLSVHRLARIGKARALLGLKDFARAAALVSVDSIPTAFKYELRYNAIGSPNYVAGGKSAGVSYDLTVANRLGGNGLNYLDAGAIGPNKDPRVGWYSTPGGMPMAYPSKFADGSAPIPLADGIEARLIQAEALLNSNNYIGWASILNELRQSAGSVAIPALPVDSTTGANQALREDVMFRERAFWLYGTGHRFGDMRRLVRQYLRPVNSVFPTGANPLMPTPNNIFSNKPNFAPPQLEADTNPYFSGCFNRDA